MIEIKGRSNVALCFAETIDEKAAAQIQALCDRPEFAESKIRIMPDVHAGKGCTIGTTMTITDKVVPSMVGVDIGCGMETVRLADREIDYATLDGLIRREIPSGRGVRQEPHRLFEHAELDQLRCLRQVNLQRACHSIGTLGGGNHFIEIDRSDEGDLFLVIHSGSRHIGTEVADYYQEQAARASQGTSKQQIDELIERLKAEGRQREIATTIATFREQASSETVRMPKDWYYVSDQLLEDYLHDMNIIQRFAQLNRQAMAEVILQGMGLREVSRFSTIHNYIDLESMILRKGAVSARQGELLLIPINMRDGSLVCVGKGNDDWNQSAPHGAGRLMSRKAALRDLSMAAFTSAMEGIFTTSVSPDTLDESPMAYKSIEEIVRAITPTAEIVTHLHPTYNFKAAE